MYMAHVYYHCGGAGKPNGTRTVDLPFYPGGIVTFAWAPPHDLPDAKTQKIDARLRKKHDEMIEIIAKATGYKPYFKPRGEIP